MATCPTFKQVRCVFRCNDDAADSLEHYCRCPKLQERFEPLTQYRCRDIEDSFWYDQRAQFGRLLGMCTTSARNMQGCTSRTFGAVRLHMRSRTYRMEPNLLLIIHVSTTILLHMRVFAYCHENLNACLCARLKLRTTADKCIFAMFSQRHDFFSWGVSYQFSALVWHHSFVPSPSSSSSS